jgi:hypothetical protein
LIRTGVPRCPGHRPRTWRSSAYYETTRRTCIHPQRRVIPLPSSRSPA